MSKATSKDSNLKFNSDRADLSLDPENWPEMRELGHRMVDDMMDYLQNVRSRPVWQSVPTDVKQRLNESVPREASSPNSIYQQFQETILPYPTGNIHPRFWGWVMGTGSPMAMLADMLTSAMNSHVAGYDQAASLVENNVIDWLIELMGMPATSSGLLVSGATMANIVGITVARNHKAGYDIRKEGLQNIKQPLVLYGSAETHSWIQKCVELLGLGNNAFRRIPVNEQFEIDTALLVEQIKIDRAAGLKPFCIVGNAGTVNTGATDDLDALADICEQESLWFHVDGAFGAFAILSEKLKSLVKGMDRADSLAIDLHKWMYLPYGVGCILVRDPVAHKNAFAMTANYLRAMAGGIAPEPLHFANMGIELSRSFRALKVWISLKTHGINHFAQLIEQNVAQVKYLCELVHKSDHLELMADVPLNVVCLRYRVDRFDDTQLDELNRKILIELQERGIAVLSSTYIKGRFALRIAHTNHRTQGSDFDLLVDQIEKIGHELIT